MDCVAGYEDDKNYIWNYDYSEIDETVEDRDYDATARTQKINTDLYGNVVEDDNKKRGKKDNKFVAFIKRHKVLSSFIGLILLFAISLGGTLAYLNITNPAEVQLPEVVGMSKEEAQKTVEDLKLVFEVSSEEFNKDVPEGYVVSQDPTYIADYHVKEGSTVKVVISKGQEKTTVPNVEGEERSEAIKMLEDAKLKAEVVEETSKTVKEGYVISQETEADSEAYAGDTVKIHVSTGTGIKQVTVQNVVGQTEANAKSTLEGQGLKVTINYVEATSNDGKVTAQSVTGGTTVDEGTNVTLTVNKVAENKDIVVNVSVKKLVESYFAEQNEETEETTNRNVNVKVNNETRTVSSTTENCQITLSGKEGESLEINVSITDPNNGGNQIYSSSRTITLGSQDTITF